MARRPIKVTGHHRFHLRGRLNHFPRANLAGESDAKADKIPFDRKKVAWVRAYVDTFEKVGATADSEWLTQAKKQLEEQNPGVKPSAEQIRLLAANLAQGGPENAAAYRAFGSKSDALQSSNPANWDGGSSTIGYGEAAGAPLAGLGGGGAAGGGLPGLAMRGLRSLPGMVASAVPAAGAMAEAISDRPIDRKGQLTDRLGVHADPSKQVQGQGDDQVARLLAEHAAAQKSGDTAKAQQLQQQLQQFKYEDPSAKARNLGNEAGGSVGSQVGRLALSSNPLVTAAMAPLTKHLTGDTGGTAQMVANEAALYPLVRSVGAPAGEGILGRAASMGKNLMNPRLIARGGALVGGVSGVADLARMGMGDGSFQAARDAGTRANVIANDTAGAGEKTWSATKAGLQAGLTGNLAPAREQLGAAYGRFDPSGETPMGRNYIEAQRDLKTQRGANEGYQQTKEMLRLDPRFKNATPEQIEQIAAQGMDHAAAGAAIDAREGDLDQKAKTINQESTRDLTAYTNSLDRYHQGKATPQDMQVLEQLAGSPAQGGKFDASQLNQAGRNAMAVHRLGRSNVNADFGTTMKAPQVAPQVPKQVVQQSAAPAMSPIDQMAHDLVAEGGDRAGAMQRMNAWSQSASPEDKTAFAHAILKAKGLPDFVINHMTPEMQNAAITKGVGDAAQAQGNEIGQQASKDYEAGGGVMGYLKTNPMLALLPLGLLGMFSGNKMGKMLGILALAGGAYSLYQRYQGMKDPQFLGALAQRAHGMQTGAWTPEQQQQFEKQYGTQWHDVSAAAGGLKVDMGNQAKTLAVDSFKNALPGGADQQAAQQGQPPPRKQVEAAKAQTPATTPPAAPQQPGQQPQQQPKPDQVAQQPQQQAKPQQAPPAAPPAAPPQAATPAPATPAPGPTAAMPKPAMPKPQMPQAPMPPKPQMPGASPAVAMAAPKPATPKPATPMPAQPAVPKPVAA